MSIKLFKKFAVSAVAVAGLALSLVVVGCGGDDDDNNSGNNGGGDCTQGVNCPGDNPGGGGGDGSTFKDSRDGQTYKQVTIGSQTWMAENLNYAGSGGNVGMCYINSPDSCAKYGRLYTWVEAMAIAETYLSTWWKGDDANHQGICPSGWRVPSNADWDVLVDYVNTSTTSTNNSGTNLKSQTGWNDGIAGYIPGTDQFGFSALPGGYRYPGGSYGVGVLGNWWSATDLSGMNATHWDITFSIDYMNGSFSDNDNKRYGYSVRCVKD